MQHNYLSVDTEVCFNFENFFINLSTECIWESLLRMTIVLHFSIFWSIRLFSYFTSTTDSNFSWLYLVSEGEVSDIYTN